MIKYPGLDTFYSNFSADWVVYIIHENTIAFGGLDVLVNPDSFPCSKCREKIPETI